MQDIYLKQTTYLVYVRSLLHSSSAGSQKSASPTDQAIFIHRYEKNFLTIQHILSIGALCIRIYRAGQKLNSMKLLCNLFGFVWLITTVVSTSGIVQAIFRWHILMLFLQVCILLELLGDGAVKVVTVRNYCIYQVSFFGGFFAHNFVRVYCCG
jgi:hypothetical protein